MREKVFSHPLLLSLSLKIFEYIRIYLSLIIVPTEKKKRERERKPIETNIHLRQKRKIVLNNQKESILQYLVTFNEVELISIGTCMCRTEKRARERERAKATTTTTTTTNQYDVSFQNK